LIFYRFKVANLLRKWIDFGLLGLTRRDKMHEDWELTTLVKMRFFVKKSFFDVKNRLSRK
jgi:hypothetical protein